MKIVLVEPGKEARAAVIPHKLKDMQEIVGGIIQVMYPWEDPVALVCNDEGKILGMPLNRLLEDYDVIAGTFFLCGIRGDHFCSLTEKQVKTYIEKFRQPELIWPNHVGVAVCRCSEQEYAEVQRMVEEKTGQTRPKRQEPER